MDTDILNNLTDCKSLIDAQGNKKPCAYWYETLGECQKPANVECPEGIRQPQQDIAEFY